MLFRPNACSGLSGPLLAPLFKFRIFVFGTFLVKTSLVAPSGEEPQVFFVLTGES